MADIFDLAQKINAQRQRASQGYSSPLENLPLQIGQIFAQRDKEKRVSLKQDATILNNLIQGASTEEQIANMEKMVRQYGEDTSGDSSLKLYNQVVQSNAKSRRDIYTQGKNALDWIDQNMNKEVPDYEGVYEAVTGFEQSDRAQRHNNPGAHIWTPELEKEYGATKGDSFTDSQGDEYWIANYENMEKGAEASKFVVKKIWDNSGGDTRKFVEDYSSSSDESTLRGYEDAVNGKVGKGSYFNYSVETMRNWSIDDIESRIRELDKFERGMKGFVDNKFQYGKGSYSDVTLMKEFGDYRTKLDATMKAHLTAGIISEEEALSIMRGTYKIDRIETIKTIDANISRYDKAITGLQNRKWESMQEDQKNAALLAFNVEGGEGLTGAALQKKITEAIQEKQKARNLEYKRKHLWTGRKEHAIGDEIVVENGDDGETNEERLAREAEEARLAKEARITTIPEIILTKKGDIPSPYPVKTDIDEKIYSIKDQNNFPKLKKAKKKWVTTDKNNTLVEWDNVLYHPKLRKNVPILDAGYDTFYWNNGWKHLEGQAPTPVIMSTEEYKKIIKEDDKLSKIRKDEFLKDVDKGWKWIKNNILKGKFPTVQQGKGDWELIIKDDKTKADKFQYPFHFELDEDGNMISVKTTKGK